MSYGILYLSFGDTYVDCTVAALKSKIQNAPGTPAKVLTNRKADLASKLCKDNGIQVEYVEAPASDCKAYKTQAYKYSPWSHTLLLDADAWINKELAGQFQLLDIAPTALVHAFFHPSIGTASHIGSKDRVRTVQALHGCKFAPQYASGLMFFRRDDPKVHRLFDQWHEEWQVLKQKDQGALMRAIVRTQVFPLVLWRDHWLTAKQGKGFVSHRFTQKLPSMPRKDKASPMKYKSIP
jgi:hypothetical protein